MPHQSHSLPWSSQQPCLLDCQGREVDSQSADEKTKAPGRGVTSLESHRESETALVFRLLSKGSLLCPYPCT